MVKCPDCKKEMIDDKTRTCTLNKLRINNRIYDRNTTFFDLGKRCHDCNIINKKGNTHHYGCDMERCPKCDGQLISCGCEVDEVL